MNAAGTTVKGVTQGFVSNITICIPPLLEQKKIANVLMKIDTRINNYKKQKQILEELFRAMLDQLMTGKIRVHDLNIDTSGME